MKETRTYKGVDYQIIRDDYPENPRKWQDNAGILALFNKDMHGWNECDKMDEYRSDGHIDYNEAFHWYMFNIKLHAILPIYKHYDQISPSPGGNRVGFIYMTKERFKSLYFEPDEIPEYYQEKFPGASIRQIAEYILRQEMFEFNCYLNNDVYLCKIEYGDSEMEDLYCGGFYGEDHKESGLTDHAEGEIDYFCKRQHHKHFKRLKYWIRNGLDLYKRTPVPYT